jgi:hypothetical protein
MGYHCSAPRARGLVDRPEDWTWNSYGHYALGEEEVAEIASWWTPEGKDPLKQNRLE